MSGVDALLEVARGELGQTEQPPGSNRCRYSAWYGLVGPWCGMFVSWCAHQSGNDDVIPRYAYTPAGAQWFQQRGRWSRQPQVGSIVFYDVAGMGRISHTGIVEAVYADGSFLAIEGNTDVAGGRTGGSVRRQRRSTVGTDRGGFGHPQWATQSAPNRLPSGLPTIRYGAAGGAVLTLQIALNVWLATRRLPPLAADGQFGPATRTAVVFYQREHGLAADGIVGPLTWHSLGPVAGSA